MTKAVFFDLDSTLLPMDEEAFTKGYFSLLAKKAANYGYDKELLVKNIWAGTKMMIKNNGNCTNEEAFWGCFVNAYGKEKLNDKVIFDKFYDKEFKETKQFCFENPYLKDLMKYLKTTNLKVVLATNP